MIKPYGLRQGFLKWNIIEALKEFGYNYSTGIKKTSRKKMFTIRLPEC